MKSFEIPKLWVPKTSSDAATRDDVQGGSVDVAG
jgi:hypothetical protein